MDILDFLEQFNRNLDMNRQDSGIFHYSLLTKSVISLADSGDFSAISQVLHKGLSYESRKFERLNDAR